LPAISSIRLRHKVTLSAVVFGWQDQAMFRGFRRVMYRQDQVSQLILAGRGSVRPKGMA